MVRYSQQLCRTTCWLDARVVVNSQRRGFAAADLRRDSHAGLDDWLRHRYMIDADGFGYSTGLVWKLWAQRPVVRLKSSRNLTVWYDLFLDAGTHYLEVQPGDWTALRATFDTLEAHPERALATAALARDVARAIDLRFAARLVVAAIETRFSLVKTPRRHDKGALVPLTMISFLS